MSDANHLPEDDLSLFALQLLPDTEMQAVALHLKECAECRVELGKIQGDLAAYAMTAEMQAAPGEARARLLSQVAKEKKPVWVEPVAKTEPVAKVERVAKVEPVKEVQAVERVEAVKKIEAPVSPKFEAKPVAQRVEAKTEARREPVEPVMFARSRGVLETEERKRRRVAPALAWIGWAIAAGAAVTAGLQFQQRKQAEQNLAAETAQLDAMTAETGQTAQAKQLMDALTSKQAMQVSLHVPLTARQQPKLDPEGHATYVAEKGSLMFVASHLDPLDDGKTYELWLLPAEAGVTPIPAGLFKPDANGNASVVMPELPKGVTAKGFGVTVENDGGSKTPTAPIVLAGM
jgi:hypothetical protein